MDAIQIWATWRNQREITTTNGSPEQIAAHRTLTLVEIDGDYSSTYSDAGRRAHWDAFQSELSTMSDRQEDRNV